MLIVSPSAERRDTLTRAMRQDDVVCRLAESTESVMGMLTADERGPGARPFEAVIFDLARCSPQALGVVRQLGDRQIATVIVCPNVSFDEAVEAMRAGASDIVSSTIKPRELQRRVKSAIQQQRAMDPEVVRALNAAPDAAPAPRQPRQARATPHSKLPAPAAVPSAAEAVEDFARAIRHEFDVETLLRQALEFVLAHIGPTNAAVFLPSTCGDFSLGAYVNYTCPKETAEVLLDHLANVAAPRLESVEGMLSLSGRDQIREHIGAGAEWIEDGHMVAFGCREKSECLAVFMLFRERATPFSGESRAMLSRLSAIFAEQLARVVRIHHRHLPREKWGTLGDPSDWSDGRGDKAA